MEIEKMSRVFSRPTRLRFCFILWLLLFFQLMTPTMAHAKTQWKKGMWIGAASGAVVVGGALAASAASTKCIHDSDFQICGGGGAALMGVGGAVIGGLVGMGVGALIGSRFQKEEPIVLAPSFSVRKNGTYGGMVVRKIF